MRNCFFPAALVAVALGLSASRAGEPTALDRILREENADRKVTEAGNIGDLAYLRRVTVDLVGRIPTDAEIQVFLGWPAAERRGKAVDVLMKNERFTDRWTIFFADMLRLRSNATGGAQATMFVYRALTEGMPYDEMIRQLLTATGRPGTTPEAGFILSDDADPMVLAGATSQVFLGIRMACAQCHNHPFDVWTREQFYGLAAYFGKVRRVEARVTKVIYSMEVDQTSILWPPEEKAQGKPRKPVKPAFPFEMDEADGAHVARLQKARAELVARAANGNRKSDAVEDLIDDADGKIKKATDKGEENLNEDARRAARDLKIKEGARGSELRQQLVATLTSPRNKQFARAIANRLWADLLGRGIVEPVDDFRQDNPATHPKTLDYLAEEFIASNYNFRALVKMIVTTEAYQRGHLPGDASATVRMEAEKAFVATPVRRMLSEVLFDSIVQAGHLFDLKFREGENSKVIKTLVREAIPVDEDKAKPKKARTSVEEMKRERIAMALKAMPMTGGYDLESSLEMAVDPAKLGKGDFNLDMMRKMSTEEIEAERMAMEKTGPRMKYVEKIVEQKIDDNPRFGSAMRMASPAPPAHFLRIFGQPGREGLGDHRDHSASMRQALLMLNGKLTHEASRVGTLEPIYKLIAGPKKDVDGAIKLAYREILTREPSEQELTEAKELVSQAGKPVDGMADLRWVLLNCHEFRFVP